MVGAVGRTHPGTCEGVWWERGWEGLTGVEVAGWKVRSGISGIKVSRSVRWDAVRWHSWFSAAPPGCALSWCVSRCPREVIWETRFDEIISRQILRSCDHSRSNISHISDVPRRWIVYTKNWFKNGPLSHARFVYSLNKAFWAWRISLNMSRSPHSAI